MALAEKSQPYTSLCETPKRNSQTWSAGRRLAATVAGHWSARRPAPVTVGRGGRFTGDVATERPFIRPRRRRQRQTINLVSPEAVWEAPQPQRAPDARPRIAACVPGSRLGSRVETGRAQRVPPVTKVAAGRARGQVYRRPRCVTLETGVQDRRAAHGVLPEKTAADGCRRVWPQHGANRHRHRHRHHATEGRRQPAAAGASLRPARL